MTRRGPLPAAREKVVYRGYCNANPAGGRLVTVDTDGVESPLRHVVRHSPTGVSWGFGGSGPADLALSLLVDALGDAARCATCAGTGQVMFDVDQVAEVPYNQHQADSSLERYSEAMRCIDCEAGFPRNLPYQAFKWEVIATLDQTWALTRQEILEWHTLHCDPPAVTR